MEVVDYFDLDDNTTLTAQCVQQQMRKSEGKRHLSRMQQKKGVIGNKKQNNSTNPKKVKERDEKINQIGNKK